MNSLRTRFDRQAEEYHRKTIKAILSGFASLLGVIFASWLYPAAPVNVIAFAAIVPVIFVTMAIHSFIQYRRALRLKNRYSIWPPIF